MSEDVNPIQTLTKKALAALAKNIQPPPEVNYTGVHQLGEGATSAEVQKHAISQHYLGYNVANVLRAIVQIVGLVAIIVGFATLGPTIIKVLEWMI